MGNTQPRRIQGTAVAGGAQPECYIDVDLGAGWSARYRLRDQQGTPVVAELHVFHAGKRARDQREAELLEVEWNGRGDVPTGGLTAGRLRLVPVGPSVMRVAIKELSDWPPELARLLGSFGRKGTPSKEGQRARGKRFYAELAARYVASYRRDPRRPVARLADELGWTRARVRDTLHDARRAGMLTSAGKGLAGGELTEEAKRLLVEQPRPRRRT